jgi:nucleotide-binding universal stress UspA family protein
MTQVVQLKMMPPSLKEASMFKNVLIPTDGSALSNGAVEKALDFAREIGAEAVILVVMEPLQVFTINPGGMETAHAEYERQSNDMADGILKHATSAAVQRNVSVQAVKLTSIDAAGTIVSTAEKYQCDMIAMASHGRSGLKALMLGSVTMKVLAFSKTPVLVYH